MEEIWDGFLEQSWEQQDHFKRWPFPHQLAPYLHLSDLRKLQTNKLFSDAYFLMQSKLIDDSKFQIGVGGGFCYYGFKVVHSGVE